MATVIRNTEPGISQLVTAHNDLKHQVGAGSHFHLDASEVTVTLADCTDLPTAIALVKQLMAVYTFHINDTLAHKAADVTNVLLHTVASVVDLASAETAVNDLHTQYTAHIADASVSNYNADSTNTDSSASATSLTTLKNRANGLKAALNAHMADAPSSKSLRLVKA
jgi:hypothetical protein